MSDSKDNKRIVNIIRWIARTWSILILFIVIMIAATPDPNNTGRVSFAEIVALSLYGLAAAGLLAAWRWEAPGGLIAAIAPIGANIAVFTLSGSWRPGLLVPAAFFMVPGALFIACRRLSHRKAEEPIEEILEDKVEEEEDIENIFQF